MHVIAPGNRSKLALTEGACNRHAEQLLQHGGIVMIHGEEGPSAPIASEDQR